MPTPALWVSGPCAYPSELKGTTAANLWGNSVLSQGTSSLLLGTLSEGMHPSDRSYLAGAEPQAVRTQEFRGGQGQELMGCVLGLGGLRKNCEVTDRSSVWVEFSSPAQRGDPRPDWTESEHSTWSSKD